MRALWAILFSSCHRTQKIRYSLLHDDNIKRQCVSVKLVSWVESFLFRSCDVTGIRPIRRLIKVFFSCAIFFLLIQFWQEFWMKVCNKFLYRRDSPEEFYIDSFHTYRRHTVETCRALYSWVESQASTRARTTYLDGKWKKYFQIKLIALRLRSLFFVKRINWKFSN